MSTQNVVRTDPDGTRTVLWGPVSQKEAARVQAILSRPIPEKAQINITVEPVWK